MPLRRFVSMVFGAAMLMGMAQSAEAVPILIRIDAVLQQVVGTPFGLSESEMPASIRSTYIFDTDDDDSSSPDFLRFQVGDPFTFQFESGIAALDDPASLPLSNLSDLLIRQLDGLNDMRVDSMLLTQFSDEDPIPAPTGGACPVLDALTVSTSGSGTIRGRVGLFERPDGSFTCNLFDYSITDIVVRRADAVSEPSSVILSAIGLTGLGVAMVGRTAVERARTAKGTEVSGAGAGHPA